jgi:uncharacterized protein (TIGR00645 family)
MAQDVHRKPAAQRMLELWLFRSRWLLAPIYLGLTVALAALVVVFAKEEINAISEMNQTHAKFVVTSILSMLDLALAANLVLLVIFSGYQQFISPIEPEADAHRLSWMGNVDFSALKLKLVASLVAISAVALLRAFMEITDGEPAPDNRSLAWLIGIHLTFVVSGLLLALMDLISAKAHHN